MRVKASLKQLQAVGVFHESIAKIIVAKKILGEKTIIRVRITAPCDICHKRYELLDPEIRFHCPACKKKLRLTR